MNDRNCRIITRKDISEWQESMNKCAECVSHISELYESDPSRTAVVAALKAHIRGVLNDMAFLVAYVDSTLTAEYDENVSLVAVEMQRRLVEKCKGA